MITQATIEEVKNRLVKVYNPLEIYLFGSYAWGNPNEDSDLDLFVIVDDSDEKRSKRAIQGSMALFGLGIAKDIVVYTKKEFQAHCKKQASLSFKVKTQGRKIYARAWTSTLDPYCFDYRYPCDELSDDESIPSREDVQQAICYAEEILNFVKKKI